MRLGLLHAIAARINKKDNCPKVRLRRIRRFRQNPHQDGEMASIGSQRPLMLAQAGFKRDIATVFASTAQQAGAVLIRAAGADGKIAPRQQEGVKASVGQIVSNLFTGQDNRRAFGEDGVTPLAPYPRVLNQWLVRAVFAAVEQHQQWMKAHVAEDVYNGLRRGRRRLVVSEQVSEDLQDEAERLKLFAPDPMAEIDPNRQWVPPHKWQDERGYRLSDRVWRAEMETRQKIDELLTRALRDGMGALDLARLLERYLTPEGAGQRTRKPYDVPVSYSAMRLARTEISRAFNQAAYISGYLNPYTSGMEYARSPNGDISCPICPQHATLGVGGERLRPAYPKDSAPIPPAHPHCMCHVRWTVADKPSTVSADLRAMLEQAQNELGINPADAAAFTEMLLGPLFDQGKISAISPPGIQINITPARRRGILTYQGELQPDTGKPGNTLESLNTFMQNSNGPLARALRQLADFDRDNPALELDWNTDQYFINGANLKTAAKAFVAEARDTSYTRGYLVSVMQDLARQNGLRVTDAGAIEIYNNEYQYQARALLELARIGRVRLTDAQNRWLTQSASGQYFALTSAPEQAQARAAAISTQGYGGGNFATEAARREFRKNFLQMINNL